ncbi:MAG: putative porin, partial [Proteobacteria bacterium]|nr:putative porin [Pseudomonadota bacterium]
MKKSLYVLFIAIVLALGAITVVSAGEVDILVQKLVEKGILSSTEGEKILKETKQEAAKEKEQAIKEAKAAVAKDVKEGKYSMVPDWVRKTKLTGDFRLRYQWENRQVDSTSNSDYDRNRGRFRVRLGIETEVAKDLKFLFGLASGSNDPRSTNQTFSNTSDKKQINIDYAYVDYAPYKWLKVQGGKMKNPIYKISELMWDEDINPEGVAGEFTWNINESLDLFLNAGVFVVDEYAKDSNDPFMYVIQPGFTWKPTDCTQVKYALGYTEFDNLKGNTFKYTSN